MSDPIPPASSTVEYYSPLEVFYVRRPKQRYWLHGLLLLLTIFTTLVVGARMQYNFLHNLPAFRERKRSCRFSPCVGVCRAVAAAAGSAFLLDADADPAGARDGALSLLPLLRGECHASVFHSGADVDRNSRSFHSHSSPIRSRAALFDIGIAGPIAGFVVAVTVLFVSLCRLRSRYRRPQTNSDIQLGYPRSSISPRMLAILAPRLHATASLREFIFIPRRLRLGWGCSPLRSTCCLAASWMVDTSSSRLLPGPTNYLTADHSGLDSDGTLIWDGLGNAGRSCLRFSHAPPMVAEWPEVSSGRRWLAALAFLMLVLTLTPAPFSHSSLLDVLHELRSGQ